MHTYVTYVLIKSSGSARAKVDSLTATSQKQHSQINKEKIGRKAVSVLYLCVKEMRLIAHFCKKTTLKIYLNLLNLFVGVYN